MCVDSKAAMSTRMIFVPVLRRLSRTRVRFLVHVYTAASFCISDDLCPSTCHCAGRRSSVPRRAEAWCREYKFLPAQSYTGCHCQLTTRKLAANVWISVWTQRKICLSSLVLKTTLLLLFVTSSQARIGAFN